MKVGEVNSCSEIPTLGIGNLLYCKCSFLLVFLHSSVSWIVKGNITLKWNTEFWGRYSPYLSRFFSLYQPRVSRRCLSETPSFFCTASQWTLYCVRFSKEAGDAQLNPYCRPVFKFHNVLLSLEILLLPLFHPYFLLSIYGCISASSWLMRLIWNLLGEWVCSQNSQFALFPTFRERR